MIEDKAPVITLHTLLGNIIGVRHVVFFQRVFISYTLVNPNAYERIKTTIVENGFCCNILDGQPDQPSIFILDEADFNKPIERIRQVEIGLDGVRLLVVADTIGHSTDPTVPFIKALTEFTRDHHPRGEYSRLSLVRIITRVELATTKFKPGVYINADAIPF